MKSRGHPGQSPQGASIATYASMMGHETQPEMFIGEYTGTGAALDVALPADADLVMVFNLTDGTMCGIAIRTPSILSGTHQNKSYRQSTTAGFVTATTGITFGALGTRKFSLGADAIVNVNTKIYQYVAFSV